MTDSPTTRRRFRKQSVGSNTNTWGTNLNEVLDAVDQAIDGWLEYAVADGTNTLTTTNYTTADESLNRGFKFTGGTLTAAATVVVPSVEAWGIFWNAESFAVTVKTAAGTGVSIPANHAALLFCDGTNVENTAPQIFRGDITVAGQIHGVTAGTAGTDAVNKTQMDNAIAAGGGSGAADGSVKVDAAATSKFLFEAITVSGAMSKSDDGDTMGLAVGALGLVDGGRQTTDFTAAVNTRYRVDKSSSIDVTLPASPSEGDIVRLEFEGVGNVANILRNGSNIQGAAQNGLVATAYEGPLDLTFTTGRGWV